MLKETFQKKAKTEEDLYFRKQEEEKKAKKTQQKSSNEALISELKQIVEESFPGFNPFISISTELRDKIIQALNTK